MKIQGQYKWRMLKQQLPSTLSTHFMCTISIFVIVTITKKFEIEKKIEYQWL